MQHIPLATKNIPNHIPLASNRFDTKMYTLLIYEDMSWGGIV